MSARYAWWLMDRCPRWLMRLLPNVTEAELRDMTRPGDRSPILMPTGRKRWVWFGVPLPWWPRRAAVAWRPTDMAGQGRFLNRAELQAYDRGPA